MPHTDPKTLRRLAEAEQTLARIDEKVQETDQLLRSGPDPLAEVVQTMGLGVRWLQAGYVKYLEDKLNSKEISRDHEEDV